MPQPSRLEVTSDKMSKSVSFPKKMVALLTFAFPSFSFNKRVPFFSIFFADGQLLGKGEDAGEGRAGNGPGNQTTSERF